MKKLTVSLISLMAAHSLMAATASLTILPGVMTNFPLLIAGPAKIQSVSITASSTNNAQVWFVDTYTNYTKYTNSAYTNTISFPTNWITTWTNYYGFTNSFTNVALIDVTNTVAGTTNLYNVPIIVSAPTNATVQYTANAQFINGVWVTNTIAAGSATITVQYTQ